MRRNVRRLSREVSDTVRGAASSSIHDALDEHDPALAGGDAASKSEDVEGKPTVDAARSVVAAAEEAAAVAAKKRKANAKAARKATGLLGELQWRLAVCF